MSTNVERAVVIREALIEFADLLAQAAETLDKLVTALVDEDELDPDLRGLHHR